MQEPASALRSRLSMSRPAALNPTWLSPGFWWSQTRAATPPSLKHPQRRMPSATGPTPSPNSQSATMQQSTTTGCSMSHHRRTTPGGRRYGWVEAADTFRTSSTPAQRSHAMTWALCCPGREAHARSMGCIWGENARSWTTTRSLTMRFPTARATSSTRAFSTTGPTGSSTARSLMKYL